MPRIKPAQDPPDPRELFRKTRGSERFTFLLSQELLTEGHSDGEPRPPVFISQRGPEGPLSQALSHSAVDEGRPSWRPLPRSPLSKQRNESFTRWETELSPTFPSSLLTGGKEVQRDGDALLFSEDSGSAPSAAAEPQSVSREVLPDDRKKERQTDVQRPVGSSLKGWKRKAVASAPEKSKGKKSTSLLDLLSGSRESRAAATANEESTVAVPSASAGGHSSTISSAAVTAIDLDLDLDAAGDIATNFAVPKGRNARKTARDKEASTSAGQKSQTKRSRLEPMRPKAPSTYTTAAVPDLNEDVLGVEADSSATKRATASTARKKRARNDAFVQSTELPSSNKGQISATLDAMGVTHLSSKEELEAVVRKVVLSRGSGCKVAVGGIFSLPPWLSSTAIAAFCRSAHGYCGHEAAEDTEETLKPFKHATLATSFFRRTKRKTEMESDVPVFLRLSQLILVLEDLEPKSYCLAFPFVVNEDQASLAKLRSALDAAHSLFSEASPLSTAGVPLVVFNYQRIRQCLLRYEIEFGTAVSRSSVLRSTPCQEGPVEDPRVGAWLLDPDCVEHKSFNFLDIIRHHLTETKHETLLGELLSLTSDADDERIVRSVLLCMRASVFLNQAILSSIDKMQLLEVFRRQEMPTAGLLAKMEAMGIGFDSSPLDMRKRVLVKRISELESRAIALAGKDFQVSSPQQLSFILFDHLKLQRPAEKAKTGRGAATTASKHTSTSEATLISLSSQHELPRVVLEFRRLSKVMGTYLAALPCHARTCAVIAGHRDWAAKTGQLLRIHSGWKQLQTGTGRLASSDPNLQNLPKAKCESDDDLVVRDAFKPSTTSTASQSPRLSFHLEFTVSTKLQKGENTVLIAGDYAQQELRILAHLSGDRNLRQCFLGGADPYKGIASNALRKSIDKINPAERRSYKACALGVLYGQGPASLAEKLGVTLPKALQIMGIFFRSFPGIKRFAEKVVRQAAQQGFVSTLPGRRRPLPNITSTDSAKRSYAERQAVNSCIQGSSADLIKQAMLQLDREILKKNLRCQIILSVHDEIVLEAVESEKDAVMRTLRSVMERVWPSLSVPLVVDISCGTSWADLLDVERAEIPATQEFHADERSINDNDNSASKPPPPSSSSNVDAHSVNGVVPPISGPQTTTLDNEARHAVEPASTTTSLLTDDPFDDFDFEEFVASERKAQAVSQSFRQPTPDAAAKAPTAVTPNALPDALSLAVDIPPTQAIAAKASLPPKPSHHAILCSDDDDDDDDDDNGLLPTFNFDL